MTKILMMFVRINRPNFTHFKQYSGKSGPKFSTTWMSSPLGLGPDSTKYSEPVTFLFSFY